MNTIHFYGVSIEVYTENKKVVVISEGEPSVPLSYSIGTEIGTNKRISEKEIVIASDAITLRVTYEYYNDKAVVDVSLSI